MMQDYWPPPGMTDQDLTWNFKVKIELAHGQRWLTSPVWSTSISHKILQFRLSLHMVKDDWPPHMTDQDLT